MELSYEWCPGLVNPVTGMLGEQQVILRHQRVNTLNTEKSLQ